jgi:hypothetical protein
MSVLIFVEEAIDVIIVSVSDTVVHKHMIREIECLIGTIIKKIINV